MTNTLIKPEAKRDFQTSPRQQSLRINDFGFDFVRFTIFDTDYSISEPSLFAKLFEPSYTIKADSSNVINVVYDCPNPNEIDWKRFIFSNYDMKVKEVSL